MRNVQVVIKKNIPHLKIIDAKKVRYLLFTGADKKLRCIDLDTIYDAYGLFLFDSLLDMANIESESGFYFSK